MIYHNSIKFTQKGGITIFVALEEPDLLRISIVDTGIGIESKQLKRLKDTSSNRLSGYKTDNSSGIGLGLRIASSLQRYLGSRDFHSIDIESSQGHGTTVTFYLKNIAGNNQGRDVDISSHNSLMTERFEAKLYNSDEVKEKNNEIQIRTLGFKKDDDIEEESPLWRGCITDSFSSSRKLLRQRTDIPHTLKNGLKKDSPLKMRKLSDDVLCLSDKKDPPKIDPAEYNRECGLRIRNKYSKKIDENLYNIAEEDHEDQN